MPPLLPMLDLRRLEASGHHLDGLLLLVQASEGSSTPIQRCKEGKNTAEVTASSGSEVVLAPSASTYKSLNCNERVAQEDYVRLLTGSPASGEYLQVPQNVFTQKTLQVTRSARPCWCMFPPTSTLPETYVSAVDDAALVSHTTADPARHPTHTQGEAYTTELGPAQPASNDARVATVLDLKKHMPSETCRIGEYAFLASLMASHNTCCNQGSWLPSTVQPTGTCTRALGPAKRPEHLQARCAAHVRKDADV